MSLVHLLSGHPTDRLLVSSPSGEWTAGELIAGLDDVRRNLGGQRVAVRLNDAGLALRTLAALDGVAEAIVLVPSNHQREHIVRMLSVSRASAIVTDDTAHIKSLGFPNVVSHVEHIAGTPRPPSNSTQWILATTGTTQDPRLVAHTLPTLSRAAKPRSSQLARARWGLLYEWPRFAGLQVLLQSSLSGDVLIAPALHTSVFDQIAYLDTYGCTHLSATPTLWRKIAMLPGAVRLRLQQITLGGEIADQLILRTLARLFPSARITHIYATTETGVVFSVKDGLPGFPRSYLTSLPNGIAVRVLNGRLHVRSDDTAPCDNLASAGFRTADGWIDTGDDVVVNGERVLFQGRASGVINVGGNKVHAEEVEHVLMQHPDVIAARVYPHASAITGSLVAADVMLSNTRSDTTETRLLLRRFALERLPAHKAPALITIVDSIDCNACGKIARQPR